ncbi:RagB/SusD family nutrient uptake outer membrane protein [Flavicella sp.]|uniref:RagB/SusD family nutrient uptake outer membrane protein n=1 Tax=Flavicella sp. TaxID=2957742 RepID=UPI00301B450D
MKIINLKTSGIIIFLAAFLLSSCEDYLDQDPLDEITETLYFKTPEQFENAANKFYTNLGFDYGDQSSDLSNNISGNPMYGQGLYTTVNTDDIWTDNYYNVRPPIQLIQKATEYTGDQSEIAASVGTAYFFKAWHYHLLLRRFGGVPIINELLDTNSEEVYAPRNSRYEVVYQIIEDLDIAISKLPTASSLGLEGQGKVSIEVAKSLKARVLLYEATWEMYVGTSTDGDGTTDGAGSAKPAGYPSTDDMLSDAKQAALEVMNSGYFELWDKSATLLGDRHLFYLFNLEDGDSNPAGFTKSDNKEFIFQKVYDYTLGQINQNLTHARPIGPSRKMMDMYLCTDGLPVQYSNVFQGYGTMASEFENRDFRLKSFVRTPLVEYWGWGSATDGGGAQYGVDFADSGVNFDYRHIPQLVSPGGGRSVGYEGTKFTTEHRYRETREESYNYPHIRLAEVMLIYAEATVELGNGSISDADLDLSINKIRNRAGVASLTNALIAPFSDLTMIGEIRRERAIELEGENQRFDDLKRWGIAEEELNRDVCIVYITGTEYETADNPLNPGNLIYDKDGFLYGLTTGEESPSTYAGIATTKAGALIYDPAGNRTFALRNYIDPIPRDEIVLNENLLQNPGW